MKTTTIVWVQSFGQDDALGVYYGGV